MSTELQLFDGSMLTAEERSDLEKQIENVIAAHKDNRQEVNRLVFESTAIMAEADDYEDELSSRRGFKRFWGAITGSNKRLQDKINASRGAAQYAAQQTINKIAEQNVMTFDLLVAVNNKLNASMVGVGNELNRIYTGLLSFFKQYQSDLVKIANTVERLERNINLLNWQNSIEYQMLDGTEYVDLDDSAKIVCLARDFYDITQGEWSTSDLLLLKTAMGTISLTPNDSIPYVEFIRTVAETPTLTNYLFAGQKLEATPPPFSTALLGIRKTQLLDSEENYIVAGNAEMLSEHNVAVDEEAIRDQLVGKYMLQEAGVDVVSKVKHFDLLLGLLNELALVDSEGLYYTSDGAIMPQLVEPDVVEESESAVVGDILDPDAALALIYEIMNLSNEIRSTQPTFAHNAGLFGGRGYANSVDSTTKPIPALTAHIAEIADKMQLRLKELEVGIEAADEIGEKLDSAYTILQNLHGILNACNALAGSWTMAEACLDYGHKARDGGMQTFNAATEAVWKTIRDDQALLSTLMHELEMKQIARKYPGNSESELAALADVNSLKYGVTKDTERAKL